MTDDIEYPDIHVKMEGKKIGKIIGKFYPDGSGMLTERKGEGLVRLMLDADEIIKLNWMAKTLSKTQDETVEMIVRAHLMGIKYEDYDE